MFDEADAVLSLDEVLTPAAFTVDSAIPAQVKRGQSMATIPVAALAVGNIIAVVHEQPGSDHAITSVVDPAVFLVVTLADYPNFTVRVATLLVLPGKPISPEDRPFKPDVPMTFTAAAVPTVALVTETCDIRYYLLCDSFR